MRKSVCIQFKKAGGYETRVLLPQYLQSQPYAIRAVPRVLCVKSNGGMLLWLPFKWKHTGVGTAEAQRTSLIETDGRGSGWRAKALQ